MSLLKNILLFVGTVWLTLAVYNMFAPPVSVPMILRVLTLRGVTRSYAPLRHVSPALTRAVWTKTNGLPPNWLVPTLRSQDRYASPPGATAT